MAAKIQSQPKKSLHCRSRESYDNLKENTFIIISILPTIMYLICTIHFFIYFSFRKQDFRFDWLLNSVWRNHFVGGERYFPVIGEECYPWQCGTKGNIDGRPYGDSEGFWRCHCCKNQEICWDLAYSVSQAASLQFIIYIVPWLRYFRFTALLLLFSVFNLRVFVLSPPCQ